MIPFKPLPYDYGALEPTLSGDQLRLHHDVLYRRYVERTNAMTGGAWTTVEEAISAAQSARDTTLYGQASQAWAHEVYFASMRPGASGAGPAVLSILGPGFKRRWVQAAERVFGSGWVWLVAGGSVAPPQIVTTSNAELPGQRVIMAMDVWEHAFYCQYPGRKAEYAELWVDRLADWSKVIAERATR